MGAGAVVLASVAASLSASFGSASDAASGATLFRADAAGLALVAALASFGEGRRRDVFARHVALALAVVVGHAVAAAVAARPLGGAPAAGLLAAGVAIAGHGLAAAGRAVRCPAPAAAAVATGVLWAACAGVWWADALAESVPLERRHEVREAVLRADPFTAAAYAAADHERLHEPAIYADTIVASLPIEPPTALETSLLWAVPGLLLAGGAALARRAPATAGPLVARPRPVGASS